MQHVVTCGRCGAPLAEVAERSVVQTVCGTCHFKYLVINGRLLERSSRQVTLRRQSRSHPGVHGREYELRIELTGRDLETVRFRSKGQDEPLQARRGDDIAVVYSMRGNELEELLYIQNFTAGDVL